MIEFKFYNPIIFIPMVLKTVKRKHWKIRHCDRWRGKTTFSANFAFPFLFFSWFFRKPNVFISLQKNFRKSALKGNLFFVDHIQLFATRIFPVCVYQWSPIGLVFAFESNNLVLPYLLQFPSDFNVWLFSWDGNK